MQASSSPRRQSEQLHAVSDTTATCQGVLLAGGESCVGVSNFPRHQSIQSFVKYVVESYVNCFVGPDGLDSDEHLNSISCAHEAVKMIKMKLKTPVLIVVVVRGLLQVTQSSKYDSKFGPAGPAKKLRLVPP